MESRCDDGYVFGKELRNAWRAGLALLSIGMLAFLLMLWDASRKPGSSAAACMVVALVPISVLGWIPVSVKRNAWLMDLQFACGGNTVSNTMGKETRCLHLDSRSCCTRLSIPFYWGKGKSEEAFFLISEAPVPVTELSGSGGLPVLRSIWQKTDAVILPADERIQLWIDSHFEKIDTQTIPS